MRARIRRRLAWRATHRSKSPSSGSAVGAIQNPPPRRRPFMTETISVGSVCVRPSTSSLTVGP